MSMLATFVQVEPELLERFRRDPELAEGLFAPELPGTGFDTERMRALILERGPQLLGGAMDMHPGLRQEIEERVGATQEALQRGEGGDAVLRLMQERLGVRRSEPLTGTHEVLSIDKAWHGLHYLLTGSVELEPADGSASRAVLGGEEIGYDLGYGPARVFDAQEVAEVAEALGDSRLALDAAARFDPERMTELQVYPFGWEQDDREWLLSSLRELRRFYADAAARGWAVVTCLL